MSAAWYSIDFPPELEAWVTDWCRTAAEALTEVGRIHDRTVTDTGRLICETCQQPWPCATAEQVGRMEVWS